MGREIGSGTVLVKNDAALPKELRFESEPYVEGWKMVTDLDGNGLDRALQKTGWTFFRLAGDVKTTAFGIDNDSMIRRAIERILARGKSDGFNSLEITQVASVGSERFPLVRYVTVSAKWRHIQEGLILERGKDRSGLNGKSASVGQSTRISSDMAPRSRRPAQQPSAVPSMSK